MALLLLVTTFICWHWTDVRPNT